VSCQQPGRGKTPDPNIRRPNRPPLLYFLLYPLFELFEFRF